MSSIPFWLTPEHSCNYFDDKSAQSVVVDPSFSLDTYIYSLLIDHGFRRSGDQVYKPHCRNCQECIPTRLPVNLFKPNRRHQRCIKRNAETKTVIKPASFDAKHFELYQRYQTARHEKDQDKLITPLEYMQFLGSSWCNTWFVEFLIADQLSAVAVVDALEHGLSAVYTFFEPSFSGYSPGVFAVLWQIEHAKQLRLDYLYLGYWINNCRKMRYKNQFQPLSGLYYQQWNPIPNQN